ncbi:hypothetical protein [Treponema sp.]|uniref:hypothetical protein n=1 Tax=Treponema sp. TaxID=166 RepID=UPI00388F46B7
MPSQNSRFHKAASLIFAFLLLFTLTLFSSFHHIEHDCPGDDCPVCALVQTVKTNLSALNFTPQNFVQVHQSYGSTLLYTIQSSFCVLLTPVTEKIRLNN